MKILKLIDEKLEEVLLSLLLIGIVVFMSAAVISRALNASFTWTDELTRYLLVWSCFLSVSYCVKKSISIKITQFQNLVPEKALPFLKMIRHTIVLVFSIAMLPYCVTYVQQAINSGATSAAMKLPMVYIQSAPLVCFLLVTLRVAQAWLREFKASGAAMAQTVKDELRAETREELLAKEKAEEEARAAKKGGSK